MVTKFEHPDSAPEQVGEFLSRMIPYNWVDPVVVGQADRKRRRGRWKCWNMGWGGADFSRWVLRWGVPEQGGGLGYVVKIVFSEEQNNADPLELMIVP